MAVTVGIKITGLEEYRKFVRTLPTSLHKASSTSGKLIAENVAKYARMNAPRSGRRGGISENIKTETISRLHHIVYVKTPAGWGPGSEESRQNMKIYLL